jgi:adenosylmethionine-8-amino-7-oxononanoate aminotransferase
LGILSKGLGGGYTGVAAILVAPELARWIRHPGADPLPALGTMATHPLQAAACLGVLDELEAMDMGAFRARGDALGAALHALADAHGVREVRGLGHLYGFEVDPGLLWPLIEETEVRGVLLYPFTGAGHPKSEGVVIAPPLNCTEEDIAFLTTALTDAVAALA